MVMKKKFEKMLLDWPLPVIKDVDIQFSFDTPPERYGAVNRL